MFAYLPGYTMQRLNTAYAVGGADMLSAAVEYNFGLQPSGYVIVHLNDVIGLINDLGGLDITFLKAAPDICDGWPGGTFHLNGDQLMCYVRYRSGTDEIARNRRQQEVLRLMFFTPGWERKPGAPAKNSTRRINPQPSPISPPPRS